MTQSRRDNNDSPFGRWVRENPTLDSVGCGLNVSDVDWMFQKYLPKIDDSVGTREIQLAMIIEVKTYGKDVERSQQEILFYHHQLLSTKGQSRKVKRPGQPPISLWHFGVYALKMDGSAPSDSEFISWGRFDDNGSIRYVRGRSSGLHRVLSFEIDPVDFRKITFRRHHCTRMITVEDQMPLGFATEKSVTLRS